LRVNRAAQNSWKSKDIIHGFPIGSESSSRCESNIRINFRFWVRERQDDLSFTNHIRLDQSRSSGSGDHDVRLCHDFFQSCRLTTDIR
jgi:hypothetical protein